MMEFDWTTFILEVLNFLVLVWILGRLFYRPILAALDARQQKINDASAHAEQLRGEAEALRGQYEQRIQAWAQELAERERKLDEELAEKRGSAMELLKQTLANEEAKYRARNEALNTSREAALTLKAAETAFAQSAALLQRLASEQLTQAIAAVFLEDLAALPEPEQAALRKAARMPAETASFDLVSAHALDEIDRAALCKALSETAGQDLQLVFKIDPGLIAGLRAVIGECQLDANLADGLAFFRQQSKHG